MVPKQLARAIPGHDIRTVRQMRWLGTRNGALLRRADMAGFEALVRPDRGIEHQQNVASLGFGIVLLRSPSNRLEALLMLVPELIEALAELRPGQVVHVGGASRRTGDGA